MVVYKTTNIVNGKIYIGKDYHDDPDYLGSGILLKRAISKYGKQNFIKEVIVKCKSEKDLNEKEIYWISRLESTARGVGYNIADGGCGGDTFSHQNPKRQTEIRDRLSRSTNTFSKTSIVYKNRGPKISKAKKGMIFSDLHRKNLSLSHKGKEPNNKGMKFPEMSKARMGSGNPMYGKRGSEKQKESVGRANKLRWAKYRKEKKVYDKR